MSVIGSFEVKHVMCLGYTLLTFNAEENWQPSNDLFIIVTVDSFQLHICKVLNVTF